MKRSILFLYGICLLLCSNAQKSYVDASTTMPAHPRLLLTAAEEKALQKNIQSNPTWKLVHNVIIEESDRLLNVKPVERIKIGVRLLDKCRECLRRVYFLSYAWRMTHQRKYLDRCEKELLAVAAFSDWNPTHYLDVAEMTMAVAIGYDWLYNDLSEASRSVIKDAIVTKGLETSFDTVHFNHYKKWLSVINNWNQVCNSGLSFGALAVYEDYPALSAKVINRSIESIAIPMNQAYGLDGAYPEGYIYWGYGTTMNVMLLTAFDKVFHTDFGLLKAPGFLKTAHYLQNMVAPSGYSFNYSDEGQETMVQSAMFWFAGQLKDPSLLWQERRFFTKDKAKGLTTDRLLPSLLLWGNSIKLNKITAPKSNSWMGQGKNPVAALRSSWTDSNAVYFGLKAGSPFVTHGHMDIGSFVMEADGIRWAMDFGAQEYESLESKNIDLWDNRQQGQRWEIFRYNNFTHNTISVNGKLQNVDGYSPIISFSADSMFMQATCLLDSIYTPDLLQAKRGVAIVGKQYVLVQDELATNEKPVLLRWTMLTSANIDSIGSNTIALSKAGKKLQLRFPANSGIQLKTWSTNPPPHDYDAPNPGIVLIGFELQIPANTKITIPVYLLPNNSIKLSTPVKLPLKEWPNDLH